MTTAFPSLDQASAASVAPHLLTCLKGLLVSLSTSWTRRGPLRRSVVAAVASLSLLSLAACGDEDAFSGLTIDAPAGSVPEVDFSEELELDEATTKVLAEGDGEETAVGDTVEVHITFFNGYTKAMEESTYTEDDPQTFELQDEMMPWAEATLVGQKIGSRVAYAGTPEDVFGTDTGGDSLLIITELVKKLSDEEVAEFEAENKKAEEKAAADAKKAERQTKQLEKAKKNAPKAAQGKQVKPAAWAPEVTYRKGEVPTFNFKGRPDPSGKLQVTNLIEGNGPKVKKEQMILVQYVGQVFGADEPFDSSYERNEPISFPIGVGQVIEGWDTALVGQKVGSRVIVQIPPELGYGDSGQPQAGIGGTDTLVFAVDILAAV